MPEFQHYLDTIARRYDRWWNLYTLTDAEGKQKQEFAPLFDCELMAQTIAAKDGPEMGDRSEEKVERLPVTEALQKYAIAHVLVVGRPGSGKSTALARLMLDLVKGSQIPVLVELRSYQSSILELIRSAFKRHGLSLTIAEIERLLDDRKLILLIDGVNELPSESARTDLSNFRRNHSKVPMIFTTRDLGLGGDLGIEKKLEMQPLTETQMKLFVHAYLPGKADAMLGQLRDRLREFGTTPLLLWMLCEVFEQSPNEQLPSNLAGIFKVFTRMYEESSVRKHEVAVLKGDVRPLSDRRLWKRALKHLAAVMMQGEKPIDFRVVLGRAETEEALLEAFPNEKFPVRDILDDLLKYHLLQNKTSEIIEFRHQLIQEYYAAEWLLERVGKLNDETLECDHLNYLKWTEVIAITLSLIEDEKQAVKVVRSALAVDWRLGSRLAGKVNPEFHPQTVEMVNQIKISKPWKLGPIKLTQNVEIPAWFKVELLGETRSEEAMDELLNVLNDSESPTYVRLYAARALEKLGSEKAIPGLLEALKNKSDPDVRSSAARTLEALGSEKAILGLLEALKSPDDLVLRWHAAHALGVLGSEKAIPALLEAIEDPQSGVRRHTADALGKLGSEKAIPALLEAIGDSDFDVRKSAAKALGKLGSEKAIPALLKAIEDSNDWVRSSAVWALGNLDSDAAIPGLLKELEDSDDWVIGWRVAEVLGNLSSDTAISGLLNAIKHPNDSVRGNAAHALGKLGSQVAIPALLNALEDSDSGVRRCAAKALGNLSSREVISALSKALKDSDSGVRECAAEVLRKLGSEKDSDSGMRKGTAEALRSLGSKQAIDKLLKEIKNPYPGAGDRAAKELAILANYHAEAVSARLSDLLTLIPNQSGKAVIPNQFGADADLAIRGIQANCKFYNYEIYRKAIDRKPPAAARGTPEVLAGIEQTVKQIRSHQMTEQPTYQAKYKITGNPTIIEGNQFVDGDNVGTKNIYGESEIDETLKQQIAELQQIIAELETAHPDITTG